jgi:nucleoside-diphosphate-sugar epimerase
MTFPFKKALVTGGTGFIGSHLVEELLKKGVETISIDNYSAGKEENLSHLTKYNNFHEVNCDITNLLELEKHFRGIDIIFHNAASKKTICLNDPRKDLKINAEGTFNLLELSLKYNIKKFIHGSTGSVYGEAQYLPQDENHPLNPVSYYGVSKLAGERYVNVFHHLYDLNTTILRYFHVYGPRQEYSDVGGVVSIFARKLIQDKPLTIFGDGTQQRSFTYVKDVVNTNLLVATNPKTKGDVYNCASGIKISINQLAQSMKHLLKKNSIETIYEDWMPGDIKVFDIDISKLKKIGFTFKTDFDQGLHETVIWAKEYFKSGRQ